jgi:hypothetical protein
MHIGYWWEIQKKRGHWEDQDVGGWTIFYFREIGWDGKNWIDLAEDRDQWRALVNTVMNLRGSIKTGKFLSALKIGSFSRRAQLHE